MFPAESTLLQAYLTENPLVMVNLCLALLHYDAPQQLRGVVSVYQAQTNNQGLSGGGPGHFPSSLYFQRVTS